MQLATNKTQLAEARQQAADSEAAHAAALQAANEAAQRSEALLSAAHSRATRARNMHTQFLQTTVGVMCAPNCRTSGVVTLFASLVKTGGAFRLASQSFSQCDMVLLHGRSGPQRPAPPLRILSHSLVSPCSCCHVLCALTDHPCGAWRHCLREHAVYAGQRAVVAGGKAAEELGRDGLPDAGALVSIYGGGLERT
jgi:hypothetical protein